MALRKPDETEASSTPTFRSVGFMLSTLGYAVSRGFHRVLAPLELDPSQFAVLRAVGSRDGESQQALSARLRISPSRIVAIVDDLEARTLLERRPDVADRRVRRLFLTDAGRDLLRRASELAQEYERRVSEPFSEAERAQLLELLDRIATGLGLPPGVHAALRDDG